MYIVVAYLGTVKESVHHTVNHLVKETIGDCGVHTGGESEGYLRESAVGYGLGLEMGFTCVAERFTRVNGTRMGRLWSRKLRWRRSRRALSDPDGWLVRGHYSEVSIGNVSDAGKVVSMEANKRHYESLIINMRSYRGGMNNDRMTRERE